MEIVYSANNVIEANLLRDLLERERIEVQITGEFLQGGIGELPVNGIINILVAEEDVKLAEKVIQAWEQGDYSLQDE
ncbi:MAG: DUF2007 domain-containing protein [Gammaproteobacteria bacterium]|nr:DUF2007 domain-containing protein [Gammaproteobacteria bacterium]